MGGAPLPPGQMKPCMHGIRIDGVSAHAASKIVMSLNGIYSHNVNWPGLSELQLACSATI